ncbi:ATPase [Cytophaga hutchinsonii]|nr:ATPase [Cytophaga hutchinsonii]SFX74895.1 hypothetical protein SAMN04487930_10926 [Cytophaga hutchinsonii ATCC 33406]
MKNYTPIQTETTQNHSKSAGMNNQTEKVLDFDECITFLNKKGKELFGLKFFIDPADYEVVYKILIYIIKDERNAQRHKISLDKGIMLSGPVGCGKTTLMNLMNHIIPVANRYIVRSCRLVSYDFISQGYDAIHKYSYQSFKNNKKVVTPQAWCFDDLGTESSLKYYGNECNVMAEILLSRYDLFIEKDMVTHITTNLVAEEIESFYGVRVRSRMREMFNLISFDRNSKDKRV